MKITVTCLKKQHGMLCDLIGDWWVIEIMIFDKWLVSDWNHFLRDPGGKVEQNLHSGKTDASKERHCFSLFLKLPSVSTCL